MLARNNTGVPVQPYTEQEICRWVADGMKYLIGFVATGTCSAEFRLYVGEDPDPWYVMQTSPAVRTAYIADRGTRLPPSTVVSLRVIHESPGEQSFKGTILGG
jgi:hypothetical protein